LLLQKPKYIYLRPYWFFNTE